MTGRRREQPPRHTCSFTVKTGRQITCPYGCGELVDLMACEYTYCTATSAGFCLCQMPDIL